MHASCSTIAINDGQVDISRTRFAHFNQISDHWERASRKIVVISPYPGLVKRLFNPHIKLFTALDDVRNLRVESDS